MHPQHLERIHHEYSVLADSSLVDKILQKILGAENESNLQNTQNADGLNEQSPITVLRFQLRGGLILIRASINGREGNFIFDSGAPYVVLNNSYFPTMGYPVKNESAQGIAGESNELRRGTIDEFAWGVTKQERVPCDIVDLSQLQKFPSDSLFGLIGYQMFKNYAVLIDYEEQRLVLYKTNNKQQILEIDQDYPTPNHTIPFTMVGHVPIIPVVIAGDTLLFGLDSGAELNLLSNSSNERVLRMFTREKDIPLKGTGSGQQQAWFGRLQELKVGAAEYFSLATILTDIKQTNKTFKTKLSGLLGQPFLRYQRTIINFPKKELYIWEY